MFAVLAMLLRSQIPMVGGPATRVALACPTFARLLHQQIGTDLPLEFEGHHAQLPRLGFLCITSVTSPSVAVQFFAVTVLGAFGPGRLFSGCCSLCGRRLLN